MSQPITENRMSYYQYNKEKNLYILAHSKDGEPRGAFAEGIYRLVHKRQWYILDAAARVIQAFMRMEHPEKKFDMVVPVPTLLGNEDYAPENLLADWVSHLVGAAHVKALRQHGAIREFSLGALDFKGSGEISCTKAPEGQSVLLIAPFIGNGRTIDLSRQALERAKAKEVLTVALVKHEG